MTEAVVAVSAAQLGIAQGEEFDGQLDFDLGLLMACHPSDPDPEVAAGSEAALKRLSTRATQSLIKQIFSLQSHATEGGRAVTLPPPVLVLPRAKPVPQPKPLTKWQQFAKEKGIVKKKRSKLEFDEVSQDWKRRHGYKRANDEAAVPIIEASADDKAGEDPFERIEQERRKGTKARKQGGASAQDVPATIKLSTKLDPGKVRGQIAKGKAMKGDIANASHLAGVSTASMGKFDKQLKGERDGERKLPGLRNKHLPVDGGDGEGGMVSKVLGKVTRRSQEDLVNVRRAVGKHDAAKREAAHKQKLAEGDDATGHKRKKGKPGKVKNRRVPKKTPPQKAGVTKKGGNKKGKGGRR